MVQKLVASLGGSEGAVEDIAETAVPARTGRRRPAGDPGVVVKGASDVWVKLARCCTPVPGDDDPRLRHPRRRRVACTAGPAPTPATLLAEPERLVEVEWAPSTDSVFLVAIQVEALDRHRLLSDVTRVLSDERVNILSASVTTTRDRVAVSRFTFEMGDPKHLGHLLRAIRGGRGRVRRVPHHVGYVTTTRRPSVF